MAAALFILIAAFEIAFVVVRLRTRSTQRRALAIARVAAFAVLGLGLATGLVGRSLMWVPLLAWWALLAALGVRQLLRPRADQRPGTPRLVGAALGATLLAALTLFPVFVFPPSHALPSTGTQHVVTALHTYTDASRPDPYAPDGRPRAITVQFWYPAGGRPGASPLVVFSHGSLGVATSNESLFEELASHGYVVASIGHTSQAFSTTDEQGHTTLIDRGFMNQVLGTQGAGPSAEKLGLFRQWMGVRTADIQLALAEILRLAAAGEPMYAQIDPARVGLAGHSLGGSAVLAVARTTPSVKAVLSLEAPFFGDITGVEGDHYSWDPRPSTTPLLSFYSDATWGGFRDDPLYAENARVAADDNPDTYDVHLKGTGHLGLTDLSLRSPVLTRLIDGRAPTTPPVRVLGTLDTLALGFFDRYLKGEGTFAAQPEYG